MKTKLPLIVLIMLGLSVLGIVVIKSNQAKQAREEKISLAKDNLSTATTNLIKASLDVYYVANNKYPLKMEDLYQFLADNPNTKDKLGQLQEFSAKLNNFNYAVKGDRKAYNISYIDDKGNTITIQGNYDNEFH